MGPLAGRMLGVGEVRLTGRTSNRQHIDANPYTRFAYLYRGSVIVA
jgi:hypothetical protein